MKIRVSRVVLAAAVISMAGGLVPCRAFGVQVASTDEGSVGFVESQGVRVRYAVVGEGEPVVLLHGFGGRFEASQWQSVLDTIWDEYQWVGLDVRGHGRSDKPHDGAAYGVELARDVIRVLDTLGLSDAHLVGYSMGGIVALKTAALFPERVRTLTLVAQGWSNEEELWRMSQGAQSFLQVDTTTLPDNQRERFRRNDSRAFAGFGQGYPELLVSSEELTRLTMPIEIVVGSDDPRLERARRLVSARPDTRIIVVEGKGHQTVVAGPELARALATFLAGEGGH